MIITRTICGNNGFCEGKYCGFPTRHLSRSVNRGLQDLSETGHPCTTPARSKIEQKRCTRDHTYLMQLSAVETLEEQLRKDLSSGAPRQLIKLDSR